MTDKERLAFGIEIVSAMKASCYDWTIESGRIDTLMETEIDTMECFTQQWWDSLSYDEQVSYEKYCKREKERLHKQAMFVADIALKYLSRK